MEFFLLFVLVAGAWVIYAKIRDKEREANRRAEQEAARAEEQRVQECGEVVLAFANHMGYLARECVSRDELAEWIDAGISADELAARIWDACDAVEGILLGEHPLDGTSLPVRLPDKLRARHTYVVGKSGSGKTTLLRNLILQDLEAGRGLAVLAPEAEMLREELLPFIPEHRWSDIVYVDPSDTARPVPFNPLHLDEGEDLDLKVDETFTILQRVFEDDGGTSAPRMEQILRQGLYLLMRIPGTTLLDFERLLDRQDSTFRDWAVTQIKDDETERFWRRTYPAYPKDAHLPLVTRLGRFLRPQTVRSLLCAPGCLNVRGAMDEGKVLMFNLSDGLLGATNAELIGQLVVAKLQTAAMSRASAPKEERRPFSVYLDEFQTFCGVASTSYERILSRARKYGLSLTLAHQQTGQIPERLMREILGNVATVVVFMVGASDARLLCREMIGEVDGEHLPLDYGALVSLRVGEAWCKIGTNVLYMRTCPAPHGGRDVVRQKVVEQSRSAFGVEPQGPIAIPEPRAAESLKIAPMSIGVPDRAEEASRFEPVGDVAARRERSERTIRHPGDGHEAAPSPGRGGAQHKYLQSLIQRWGEANGWQATIEEGILNGRGSVDISLRKGEHSIACEIGMTTTAQHELENVQKCFVASYGSVIFISPERRTLEKVGAQAKGALTDEQKKRFQTATPEEVLECLENINVTTLATSRTVRGRKVRTTIGAVKPGEKAAKQRALSQVVTRAMKRLKNEGKR